MTSIEGPLSANAFGGFRPEEKVCLAVIGLSSRVTDNCLRRRSMLTRSNISKIDDHTGKCLLPSTELGSSGCNTLRMIS